MGVDASQVDKLAHDLGKAPAAVVAKIKPIMSKTGLQIKNQLRADLQGSAHFKQVARSVDYDLKEFGFGGSGLIQVEVGPNADRDPSAALAGIAYFGTSRGGGATVADPVVAMRREEPTLLGFLTMALEEAL